MAEAHRWDDRSWEQVWDRMLGPVQRYHFAMALWRQEIPDEPFDRRVVVELARRWRRRAITLIVLWGLWIAYWTVLVRAEITLRSADSVGFPLSMVLLGATAVAFCLHARRRFEPVARAFDPPRLEPPPAS